MADEQRLRQGLERAAQTYRQAKEQGDEATMQQAASDIQELDRLIQTEQGKQQAAQNVPEPMEPVALPQQGPGQSPMQQTQPQQQAQGQPAQVPQTQPMAPQQGAQPQQPAQPSPTEQGGLPEWSPTRAMVGGMMDMLFGGEQGARRAASEDVEQRTAPDWPRSGFETSDLFTTPGAASLASEGAEGVVDWLQSPSDEEIARNRGIEIEGAPDGLRSIYQRVPPNMKDAFTKTVVDRYYARKMDKDPKEVNVPVDYEQELGRHIYRDPYDGKWKPLDDIGVDLQDTKQMAKEILIPSVAGIAASIYTPGTPNSRAAVGNLADSATTGLIRSWDVSSLQDEGMLPEDVSATWQGAREGGITFGLGMAGDAALKSLRRAGAGPEKIPADVDVSRKQVNDMLQKWEQKHGQEASASGVKPTLGQKMHMVAETSQEKAAARAINSYETKLQALSSTQRQILEREEQNKMALQDSLQGFMQTAGKPSEPRAFRASGFTEEELADSAKRIIGEVEEPVRQQIKALDGTLARAYQDADRSARELLDQGIDPTRMPTDVKNVFDVAEENFRRNTDEAYKAISDKAGGEKVFDIAPLKEQVNQIRREAQEDAKVADVLFPQSRGVTPTERVRLGGDEAGDDMGELDVLFGDAFRRDQSGVMVPESVRRDIQNQSDYDFKTVDTALKSLREKMRDIGTSSSGEAQRAMSKLKRLESTLKDVRIEGLRKIDPELANQQQALDKSYSLGIDVLKRGIGREISDRFLQQRADGEGLIQPGMFRQVFKGDAGARSMRDLRDFEAEDVLFSGPNNAADSVGLRDNIRRGLLGELGNYTKTVESRNVGEAARVMPEDSFNRFMKDYGHAVREVVPADELQKIEGLPQLQRRLKSMEDAHKDAVKEVQQFPWGEQFLGDDTTGLFKRTWPSDTASETTKFDNSRKLRDVLREHPDATGLLSDYRKLITNDMMKRVSKEGRIDPVKMNEYIDSHEGLLKEWFTTPGGQSGTAFVNKLRSVGDMGTQLLSNERLRYQDADRMAKVLDTMARAYTGIFTMPGRALTAAKSLYSGRTQAKDADFILNPEKYVRNQEFFDMLDSPWAEAAARDGARGFYEQISEPSGTETGDLEAFPGREEEEPERRPIPEPTGRAPDHTLF